MCGRYTLTSSRELLELEFGTSFPPELRPRYNIAPTQDVLAIIGSEDGPRTGFLRWGLVPRWSNAIDRGRPMINARSETADRKPSFRDAFRKRRCLVPADGFYEWRKTGEGKVPMRLRLPGERPFAFAGLWEAWHGAPSAPDPSSANEGLPASGALHSCTILTAAASPSIAHIHDRMPVILPPGARERWIDPTAGTDELKSLLGSASGEDLEAYPVSPLVNAVRNDLEECIRPV